MGRTEPGRGSHGGQLLLGSHLLGSRAPPTSTWMTALCARLVPPSPARHAHPGPGAHHAPRRGTGLESSDLGRAVEVTAAPSDTRRHGRPRSLGRGWPGACPWTLKPPTLQTAGCPECDPGGHLGPLTFPSFAHGPLAWFGPPPLHPPCPASFSCPTFTWVPGKPLCPPALGRQDFPPSCTLCLQRAGGLCKLWTAGH